MQKQKKLIGVISVILLLLAAVFCRDKYLSRQKEKEEIRIGISVYDDDDTYLSNIMTQMEAVSEAYEEKYQKHVSLNIVDAKGNQNRQNEQIEHFVDLGYDAICVNPVDRTNVAVIIDKAAAADIPIIFFNREPVEDDLFRDEHIYYVGSDAQESGKLQGKLIAEAYKEKPEQFDHNGNGIIEYAILEGEVGHQDAIIRSEWAVRQLEEEGVKLERVTSGVANWKKDQGAALTEQWMKEYKQELELIICNNDDMALGALETLQKAGVSHIQVIGIDGTPDGRRSVERGEMFGTVGANIEQYAEVLLRLSVSLAEKKTADQKLPLERGKFIWIDWEVYRQNK